MPGSTVSTVNAYDIVSERSTREEERRSHTGNILVSAKRCDDGGLIRKLDLVLGVRGEQALKESYGRVKDNGALNASLDANVYLAVIDEVAAHTLDVRRRGVVEVRGAQSSTQLVRLDLYRTASMRYQSTTRRKLH